MYDSFQELKFVLQTLGLPVIGQVRLVDDNCRRIAVLTNAFSSARHAIQFEPGSVLTPDQATLLAELSERLEEVHQQTCATLGSELALRQSAEWRQVRYTARKALLRFSWTLELPPPEVLASSRSLN